MLRSRQLWLIYDREGCVAFKLFFLIFLFVSIDELKDRVNQLESYQRAVTGPTQSTITDTKLHELETKVDANKTTYDADFQVITFKLAQLENKTTLHASLIQDQDTRISQLDLDKVTNDVTVQTLDARLSQLEADGMGYQNNT